MTPNTPNERVKGCITDRTRTNRTSGIPYTRAASLLQFVGFLERMGAPTQRYLQQAHIPLSLLAHPENPIPLHLCYRFGEIAIHAEGIDDLGLQVAQETSLSDLGNYGRILEQSLTIGEYMRTGINLFNQFSRGEHIWLETHGEALRFYHAVPKGAVSASAQGQLYVLMITINTLRSVIGSQWNPDELQITDVLHKKLKNIDSLAKTNIHRGNGPAYFTLGRDVLDLPFKPANSKQSATDKPRVSDQNEIPDNFIDTLPILVELLLVDGYPGIDLAAEAAGLSTRTLQRSLADLGLSYSQVVDTTRMRLATHWLESTDMSIMEIALALGYTDTSNFTRAFRRRAGIPPQRYRALTT